MPGPLFRPFNSYELYRFGIFGAGDAEALAVFDALTYDDDDDSDHPYQMLGVKTGTGDIAIARASERYALNNEGLYYSVPAYEAAWNGGRVVWNQGPYSEDFSNALWVKTGATPTYSQADPNGGTTATKFVFAGATSNRVSIRGDSLAEGSLYGPRDYVFSVWLKADAPTTDVALVVYDGAGERARTDMNITATWQRFSVPATTVAAFYNGGDAIQLRHTSLNSNPVTFYAAFLQFEDATGRADTTTPSEYCPTGTGKTSAVEEVVDGWQEFGGSGITQSGTTFDFINAPVSNYVTDLLGLTVGKDYYYVFTVSGQQGSEVIRFQNSGVSIVTPAGGGAGNGTYTGVFTAAYDAIRLRVYGETADAVTVALSIKETSIGYKVFANYNSYLVENNVVVSGVGKRNNPGLSSFSTPNPLYLNTSLEPSVSFSSPVPTVSATYYVRMTGNDGNTGLSELQAVRTFSKAVELVGGAGGDGDAYRIDIGVGRWYKTQVFPTLPASGWLANRRDLEIVGAGMRSTYLTNAVDPSGVSWSDNGDGTYTATVANCYSAADFASFDSYSNPLALEKTADAIALALVDNGFFISGSDITIKFARGGAPDSDVLVFTTDDATIYSYRNAALYFADLSWCGHSLADNQSANGYNDNHYLIIDGCLFGYSSGDALSLSDATGYSRGYITDSYIAYAGTDGLSYGANCFAIEQNIASYNAGWISGASSSQCSTLHSTSSALRLGSTYSGAPLRDIADVDSTTSWNVNCTIGTVYGPSCWLDGGGGAIADDVTFDYYHSDFILVGAAPASYTAYTALNLGLAFAEVPWLSSCPAATNLVWYSRDLTIGIPSWGPSGVTLFRDQVGIDGVPDTATRVVDAGGGSSWIIGREFDITDGVECTVVCWIKKTGTAIAGIQIDATTYFVLHVDPSTGGVAVETGAIVNSESRSDGDYWRVMFSFVSTGTTGKPYIHAARSETLGGAYSSSATGENTFDTLMVFDDTSFAEARGLPPIFTEGTAVSVQADLPSADILNHEYNEVCYYCEWSPGYNYDEKSTREDILLVNSVLHDGSADSNFTSFDGTQSCTFTGKNYSAGDTLKFGVIASAVDGKMRICIDGVWSSEQNFDGAYVTKTLMSLMASSYPMELRNLRRYAITGNVDQKAKIDELMA